MKLKVKYTVAAMLVAAALTIYSAVKIMNPKLEFEFDEE